MTQKLSFQCIATLAPRAKPYEICDSAVVGLRLRVQPSGIKTYLFSYRNGNGQRRRLTIGRYPSLTPAQARTEAKKAVGAVASRRDPHQEKQDARLKANATSLRDFLDHQYGPWVEVHRRSGNITLNRIRYAFASLMKKPLLGITPIVIERWRTARRQAGISPVTIDRDLAALKSLYSSAVAWQVIEQNPIRAVKLTGHAAEPIVRYLSQDEEARLRAALQAREATARERRESGNRWRVDRQLKKLPDIPDTVYVDHLQPMVLLSLNTGLRRGEVFRLLWGDINLNPVLSVLSVRAAAAKSGRPRKVPLNREAVAALTTWRAQQGTPPADALVFEGRTGTHFNNTKRSWVRVLRDAGVERFRWHDMRHHFASRLVMAGVDLNTVRELLGHGDLKMTLRYAHLAPEHKAAAVEKLLSPKGA